LLIAVLCAISSEWSTSAQGLDESTTSATGGLVGEVPASFISINLTVSDVDISRTFLSRQALYRTPMLPQVSLLSSSAALQSPFAQEMKTFPLLERSLADSNNVAVPLSAVQDGATATIEFTLSVNKTTVRPGELLEVMQKQISLGLTTSSSAVNTKPTYFNQSGLSIDDLWLVEVDSRNSSIVSGMKSDGLASNGNQT